MDIERVETFAGRASPRGLVILASAVEQRRTGLGPYSGPTRAQFRGPALPTPTRLCGCVRSEKFRSNGPISEPMSATFAEEEIGLRSTGRPV